MAKYVSSTTIQVDSLQDSSDKIDVSQSLVYQSDKTSIALFVPSASHHPYIPLDISPGGRLTFGRSDPTNTVQPDIDLSLYKAAEKGISRFHVAIEWQDDQLIVTDLGSTNGTYVNGRLLGKNQSHILKNRDELRLGKLTTHLIFA